MSLDICNKVIDIAQKLGADQVEAFYFSEDSIKAVIKKGELKRFERSKDEGIGIRVVINKSLGFYYTTNLNSIEDAIRIAIKLAKAGRPDPNFVSFPSKKPYHKVDDLYDKSIENVDEESISNILEIVLKKEFDKRIKSVNSEFSVAKYEEAIMNNLGVEGYELSTLATFFTEMSANEGENYSSSSDWIASRFLKEIDAKEVVNRTQDFTLKGLNKKRVNSGEYQVLLDPIASLYLLCITLNSALNADLVQRKRSFLSEELNKEIANEKLTVIDDGILRGGIGSSSFDGEGSPSQRNVLIEKGILRSFMYDSYTAAKEGKESTGNAVRSGFRNLPTISARNLIFSEGNKLSQDIISEINKGIYFKSTYDTPNVITGEFSGMINEGFYVEDGEIKHALLQTAIGVYLKKFLNNMVEFSKDSRWVFNYKIPYILVEKVKVAGQ